jgi:hypothetical protein
MSFNFLRGPTSGHLDLSRMLWAISVLSGIGLAAVHWWREAAFSIIEFGTGMGLLMAGGGGATALKDTAISTVKARNAATDQATEQGS